MTHATATERQFQERIARAKEAARLASIAAMSRQPAVHGAEAMGPPGVSTGTMAPPPPPPPQQRFTHTRPPAPAPPMPIPPHVPVVTAVDAVPDAVRHRIDRLVEFIARNGPVFEETARHRERENPDFAFLFPGAPFHDYFQWKKTHRIAPMAAPAPLLPLSPHPHHGAPVPIAPPPQGAPMAPPPARQNDPIVSLPVGAMADALKIAKLRGQLAYSPLPPDLLVPRTSVPAMLPRMEPARLETRLAEFYRYSSRSP